MRRPPAGQEFGGSLACAHAHAGARLERAAGGRSGAVLLPGAELGALPRWVRVRHARRCRSTTTTPAARPSTSRCSRTRPTTPPAASARWSSTPAVPARPARRTPRTPRFAFRRRAAGRLRHRRLRPPRHRRLQPGRLPVRPGARRLRRLRPRPRHTAGGLGLPGEPRGVLTRAASPTPTSLVGHVTTIEAARDMDVLRAALGEAQLLYFGASYGTKLGADLRRPVPGQGRPDGARRSRRPVHRLPAAQPRAGRRLRGGAALLRAELRRRGRLLPRRHRRRRA